jgi:hypothetical protein
MRTVWDLVRKMLSCRSEPGVPRKLTRARGGASRLPTSVEATDPAVSRQVMPELMVKMGEFKMASDGQTHVILIKG